MANVNVFLLSIFVIASSLSSFSHGLILNGLQIGTIQVRGVLRCTLDANVNAPVVSAQTVFLSCAGSSTNLGQAVTDSNGAFYVAVKLVDSLIFDPLFCHVTVKLPVATCSVYPKTGVLRATISLVDVVTSSVGNIANFATGPFLYSLI